MRAALNGGHDGGGDGAHAGADELAPLGAFEHGDLLLGYVKGRVAHAAVEGAVVEGVCPGGRKGSLIREDEEAVLEDRRNNRAENLFFLAQVLEKCVFGKLRTDVHVVISYVAFSSTDELQLWPSWPYSWVNCYGDVSSPSRRVLGKMFRRGRNTAETAGIRLAPFRLRRILAI